MSPSKIPLSFFYYSQITNNFTTNEINTRRKKRIDKEMTEEGIKQHGEMKYFPASSFGNFPPNECALSPILAHREKSRISIKC